MNQQDPDDEIDDSVPVIEEGMDTIDLADTIEEEELDPLEQANLRAENAEKEIAYKDAEIRESFASVSWLKKLN